MSYNKYEDKDWSRERRPKSISPPDRRSNFYQNNYNKRGGSGYRRAWNHNYQHRQPHHFKPNYRFVVEYIVHITHLVLRFTNDIFRFRLNKMIGAKLNARRIGMLSVLRFQIYSFFIARFSVWVAGAAARD